MPVRPDISGRLENLWLIWAEDFGPGKIRNKFDLGLPFVLLSAIETVNSRIPEGSENHTGSPYAKGAANSCKRSMNRTWQLPCKRQGP